MRVWFWNKRREYIERKVIKYANALFEHTGALRFTFNCERGKVVGELHADME